jgi:signal transduction histidine kinase
MQSLNTLPVIQGGEGQLFSLIYNLVHNAIPEVGANGSITIKGSLQEGGQRILVSVIDTGEGMSPEVKASLFTPQAVSRKAGGIGLGTKSVKDVVDAHGGQVSVECERGAGTAFHILLPVTQPGLKCAKGSGTDNCSVTVNLCGITRIVVISIARSFPAAYDRI